MIQSQCVRTCHFSRNLEDGHVLILDDQRPDLQIGLRLNTRLPYAKYHSWLQPRSEDAYRLLKSEYEAQPILRESAPYYFEAQWFVLSVPFGTHFNEVCRSLRTVQKFVPNNSLQFLVPGAQHTR